MLGFFVISLFVFPSVLGNHHLIGNTGAFFDNIKSKDIVFLLGLEDSGLTLEAVAKGTQQRNTRAKPKTRIKFDEKNRMGPPGNLTQFRRAKQIPYATRGSLCKGSVKKLLGSNCELTQ